MVKWSTEALSIPITSLHIIDNFLLVGEGGSLRCYRLDGGPELSRLTVFSGARVHGVTERQTQYPVHNASDQTQCPVHNVSDGATEDRELDCSGLTVGGYPAELRQLIVFGGKQLCLVSLDAVGCLRLVRPPLLLDGWLLDVTLLCGGLLAALDAHGRLLRLTADLSRQAAPPVRCPDRCLLYSGALLAPSSRDDTLLAFCGTVFCQVLIWAPGDGGGPEGDGQVLHRLTGHTGVIFRLTLTHSLDTLLSCSDDRSVRLWRRSGDDWRRAAPVPTGALFGHEARVWSALPAGQRIVSVGEDSRVCLWSADGRLERRWRAHAGTSVRAAASDAAGSRLATGGGDGAVLVWPLSGPPPAPSLLLAPAEDRARSLQSLDGSRQLMMTDAGRLLLLLCRGENGGGGGGVTTVELLRDPRLASYALLAVAPDGRRVALAGRYGHVITLRDDGDSLAKVSDQQVLNGKIYSVHWLDADRLLVCDGDGQLSVLSDVSGDLSVCGRHQLPPSKQRWVSAAALCPPDTLVVTDRDGSLHVFQPGRLEPVQTLLRLVGRYGATSITRTDGATDTSLLRTDGATEADSEGATDASLPRPDDTTEAGLSRADGATETSLLVTARDGTARHLRLGSDGLLRQTSCLRLPWDWVAGVTQLAGHCAIVGFHASQLVLWSVPAEREVWRVDCGGGHRSWALSVSEELLWFSWVSEGNVRHVTCPLDQLRTTVITPGIQGGGGTLSAALLGPAPDGSTLVALAGQDGTVRLVSAGLTPSTAVPRADTCLRPVCTLRGHISAVRAVCSAGPGHLVSAGGRGQMILWRLTDGGAAALQISSHMVRPERRRRTDDTPETRYMDLAARQEEGDATVAAAGSDGVVRLFGFSSESPSPRLTLLACVSVAGRCLLRLRWLHPGRLAVTGTDGAIWLCAVPPAGDGVQESGQRPRQGQQARQESSEAEESGQHQESSKSQEPGQGQESKEESGQESSKTEKSIRLTGLEPGLDEEPTQESSEAQEPVRLPGPDEKPTQESSEAQEPVRLLALHQSGVNALEVLPDQPAEVLPDQPAGAALLTGGDDGALCLSRLSAAGRLLPGPRLASAHSSQVTGVAWLSAGRLLSVSVDQRVCVWQQRPGTDLLQMVSCRLTSVADVKGLLHWTDRHGQTLVLVYGEGVELLRLELDDLTELRPRTATAGNS